MPMDLAAVATCAANKLRVTDTETAPFAQAAYDYVISYTGIPDEAMPDTDDLLSVGLCLLACRIYQDTPNPSGGLSGFDDFTAGTFTPRNLYSHLDQYWTQLEGNENFPRKFPIA
jgi:hypothetical protein